MAGVGARAFGYQPIRVRSVEHSGQCASSAPSREKLLSRLGALQRGESVTLQARIAQALGLSEFGLAGGDQLQSTVVVLGKKISSRAYLTFEQGLRGVSRSVAKLRYELNPRWSVQAATGTENAVDLFYTIRFD